ncbi:GRIP and coiled-coil domain-containing protein 2-like isoform X2 [Maniola hyperantus]|uniref:GRIP and coiled-coil domain-containing protein 2-like isoform X2 n=1 Tax=Aphantopus hyperantus TaxID=2795564 RepID=UPI0015690FE6|nr:GRIP and coiled-coil domain-containing protein 2-like isoform X2 [Maniola hyperantus]
MDKVSEAKGQDLGTKKSPFDDLSRDELITKCKGFLAIAQKAKQAKSELQVEVDKYKAQFQECETERKIKLDNVQMLQELVDSLTEQKLTFITEIDTVQSKVRALSNKCNHYEEEINKKKAELILRDQNLSAASQKLSDFDIEVISLKRQNNRLLEENEQLITQLTELEARTEEFNNIGLQQREQLKVLEEKVQYDESYQMKIEEFNNKIKVLEKCAKESAKENKSEFKEYQSKIDELNQLYEHEKSKLDKANIKLRSYKEKILKCASCINQLKNSRFILTKTVKEYSDNIPKWQNEIINASKAFDKQMQQLNDENISLKEKLQQKEKELNDISLAQSQTAILKNQINAVEHANEDLLSHMSELKQKLNDTLIYNDTLITEMTVLKSKESDIEKLNNQILENNSLKEKLSHSLSQLSLVTLKVSELETTVENLVQNNLKLNEQLKSEHETDETKEKVNFHIKALESEKSTLVKEKLNAKDTVIELENQNKIINDQFNKLKLELQTIKEEFETLSLENIKIKTDFKLEKENSIKHLKNETISLKEQYDKLKKEYENLQDLNSLLQEEVETLKLSLEQPKDDSEHLTDLNDSLQADIVKLETKLSAYKQENASLLMEVKESRSKVKEFDNLASEYEDAKSKLVSYKTENAELLNEMKEINQVLKERGESISKLQKAVSEMERLIETLEKDRDSIRAERDILLEKVETLENDLKNAEQNTSKNSQAIEKIVLEKDMALKSLQEKENIISGLKEDLDKLKQQSCTFELPNEDMSTSTITKAEENTRMKDLDETFEDKYTKLRMFALKLKKKLNETTAQLQTSDQEKTKLKTLLANCSLDNKQMHVISQDVLDSPKSVENEEHRSDVADLEAKFKKMTADLEVTTAKVVTLEADILMQKQQLATEIDAHRSTKEQLEKALRDVKKKNVLSLEMEDYERSMKDLTTKMEENKKKIIQMESTIDMQEGTITAMKTQIKLLEEQIKIEETQSRLLKEELQQAMEDGKEKDNVINSKKDFITKLMQELEDEKRKNEEADLEMTSVLSEKEKIIMSFGDERTELNNRTKKLEFKCAELNGKLQMTNIELADLKTEYTSYKVRAQAVLRQNQTIDHSQEEQLKEEAAALKAQVDTLTQKLATVQEQSSELSAEVEAGRKRLSDASAEAGRAHQRTARLQADLTRLSQQLESERSQHKLQVSTLTQCYKSQISDLEAKLQKETENLKKQIALLQENLREGRSHEESSRDKYMLPVIPREEGSDGEMDINVSLIPREEGEGSESAPSPPLSKSILTSGGRRSPVPLERLLEEGVPENDSLDTSSLGLTSDQEIAELRRKILAQQQRVKHVTVLLAESEREGARLAQLSELLKAELRRVRASAGNAHNTEYMKHVTLKFLTLPPGDERSRLVPVLQKILTLTSDEMHKIQAIAKGQDPNPSKGWGSYLPWPGGK